MDNELNIWAPLLQFVSGEISYDEALNQTTDNMGDAINRCVEAYVNNETILFENGSRIVILPAGENHCCEPHEIRTPIVNDDGTVDYYWDEQFLQDILKPFEIIKDTFDKEVQ